MLGNNRVIATTRRRDTALTGHGRRLLEVDVFTPGEARTNLRAKLTAHGRAGERDLVDEVDGLAADLGFLPLALAEAAAYLIDADLDCAAYRVLPADRRRWLGEVVPEPGSLPDDHHHVVTAAWSLSIERADQTRPAGLARRLLQLCSVLDPNGIPATILDTPPVQAYLTNSRATSTEPGGRGNALVRLGGPPSQVTPTPEWEFLEHG